MKQYVVDELRRQEREKIKSHLEQHYGRGSVEGIYWIPLDPHIFTPVQSRHRACQPFYFALEVLKDRLVCELLIRTRHRVRCDCMGYATENQRNWLIRLVDGFLDGLGIRV